MVVARPTAPAGLHQDAPARRVDRASGYADELRFIGPSGSRILTCLHLPLGKSFGGVVICSSVRAEFETNYRREVLLGRKLATSGIAALRFHYRGVGNSEGSSSEVTLETMQADAAAALDYFSTATGIADPGVVGTRLGASVALAVAAEHGLTRVVLWEPVVDAHRYFRDVFRVRRMWATAGDVTGSASESALEELHERGAVDVLGYPIDLPLYESVVRSSLHTALERIEGSTLLIQFRARSGINAAYRRLEEASGARRSLSCVMVDEDESWWLEPAGERQDKRVMIGSAAVDETVAWLRRELRPGGGM